MGQWWRNRDRCAQVQRPVPPRANLQRHMLRQLSAVAALRPGAASLRRHTLRFLSESPYPRRRGVAAVSWTPSVEAAAADAAVVFARSADAAAVKAVLCPAAQADFNAASSGSATVFYHGDRRVVAVKLTSPEADDTGASSPSPLSVDTFRSGSVAAVAKLRQLPGVASAAFDLASVAAATVGEGGVSDVAAARCVVQAAVLSNYAFDKYATSKAAQKKLSTLKQLVRLLCLAAAAAGGRAFWGLRI